MCQCIHWSRHTVLGVRVFVTLLFGSAFVQYCILYTGLMLSGTGRSNLYACSTLTCTFRSLPSARLLTSLTVQIGPVGFPAYWMGTSRGKKRQQSKADAQLYLMLMLRMRGAKLPLPHIRGVQILRKYRRHHKILVVWRATWSKFGTEQPQILGATGGKKKSGSHGDLERGICAPLT
jgi:hypothetical protein